VAAETIADRNKKIYARVQKLLDPDEEIVTVFNVRRGRNPRGSQPPHLPIFIAITNRNIVAISLWLFTARPYRVLRRLPYDTVLGPLDNKRIYSRINIHLDDNDVPVWVHRRFYGQIEVHDSAVAQREGRG
jgi:hypothetical protein